MTIERLQYRVPTAAIFYQPPRACDPLRLSGAVLIALLVTIVGAVVYVRLHFWLDSILLKLGLIGALGVGTGIAAWLAINLGRVRNQTLGVLVSCALGLVALYVAWIAWLHLHVRRSGFDLSVWSLVGHPRQAFALVRWFNQFGTWKYQGQPIAGVSLYMLWTIEALAIVVTATLLGAQGVVSKRPFCKTCNRPADKVSRMPRFAASGDDSSVVERVLNHDFESLLDDPGPLRDEDDPQIDFVLHSCPKCGDFHTLSVTRSEWVLADAARGTLRVKTDTLVDRMLIGREQADRVRTLRELLDRTTAQAGADEQHENSPQDPAG